MNDARAGERLSDPSDSRPSLWSRDFTWHAIVSYWGHRAACCDQRRPAVRSFDPDNLFERERFVDELRKEKRRRRTVARGEPVTARILIVDDNAANLAALEAVLAPLDRPIVSASSGEQALMRVLSSPFAVILLDVKMQGIDGFETASMIRQRERSREIPIIFLTAYGDALDEMQRAYHVGAVDFIAKPFNPDILRYKAAAFVRLYEQAEQLSEAKETARLRDMFVAVLGHDLRNPLTAVSMAADMLGRAQDIPERHRNTIDRIVRSSTRMQRLISDVLDFTRGQLGGGIPLVPEDALLDEICQPVIDEIRQTHPNRAISLGLTGDMHGHWDVGRLSQVVSNLIGNAVQHATDGAVRVRIDGTDDTTLTLAVTNTGIISREILPRLFEPFQRGDANSAGLGLGLYIVREVVRAHGGHVEARSDRLAGETIFLVHLPRQAVQSERD